MSDLDTKTIASVGVVLALITSMLMYRDDIQSQVE